MLDSTGYHCEVSFPDVIKMMSDDLDWTTDLGDAEVNQPEDVADVIQELRARAEQNGVLKTTEQQTVTTTQQTVTTASGGSAQQSYIEIQPTEQRLLLQDPYRAGAVGARRRLFLPHHQGSGFSFERSERLASSTKPSSGETSA